MAFHRQSLLIGISMGIFALTNVGLAGNKANLPDLPLNMDSLEYLVDENTKKYLTKQYHDQIEVLRHFSHKMESNKQKKWFEILVTIVIENEILFHSLLVPICGINEKVIQYTESLANEELVDGFDINVHNDMKQIFEFAVQYRIVVEKTFLRADQNISSVLEQYKDIGHLDADQLFTLEANMETLKNTVDDNVSYAKAAVEKLNFTLKDFVDLSKKLANILHKLQVTIQLKMKNVEKKRKTIISELKSQLALCLEEISKLNVQNAAQLNIDGIMDEMQFAEDTVARLFEDIRDVILRREPENLIETLEVELLPEISITKNTPQMKLDLSLPNLKPLTINTKCSRVKYLIDYFNQYANIVTPRQLVNSAKNDAVLMDLLKKDQINITLDEKQLVKSKISRFENCKIPKAPKAKKVAASIKLSKSND